MSRTPAPPIKAVVFDLDGLMFNTEVVFTLTGTELLRRRGKPAPREVFDRMMGRRAAEAFQVMIDMMELTDSIPDLQQESEFIFRELLDEHLRPMPGLFALLHAIEGRELPKGVATSSSRGYLTEMLGRFSLADRFQLLLGAEDVTHGKPDPEIYRTAAARLDVEPSQMLVLEDSEAGTRAAAAAGAHIIAVPHEHCCDHDYSSAKAIARDLVDPVILNLLRPE